MSAETSSAGTVVVCGATHGGLSIVRSLARRGIHIAVLTYNTDEPGLASKYIDEWERCPHPNEDEDAFVEFLLARVDRWEGALIAPTNDHYATALSRQADRLEPHYRLAVPPWETARIFIEKDRTYALAEECGVDYPRLVRAREADDLDEALATLRFPMMVKPVRSHEFAAHFNTKLFVADDEPTLRREFQRCVDAGLEVVVCEVIPGTDYRTLERVTMYIDATGEIRAEFYNTKLRQTPPMFGICKAAVSTGVYDEVREQTLRLLRACDYRGQAGVEFKRDPRDGRLKLIEINVRFLADTQFAMSAGVDLPWIVYQDLVLERRDPPVSGRPGVYYVHLLTDVYEFITLERHRFRELRRYVEPYLSRGRAHAFFSLDDPRPFAREVRQRFGRGFRKLRRR